MVRHIIGGEGDVPVAVPAGLLRVTVTLPSGLVAVTVQWSPFLTQLRPGR